MHMSYAIIPMLDLIVLDRDMSVGYDFASPAALSDRIDAYTPQIRSHQYRSYVRDDHFFQIA